MIDFANMDVDWLLQLLTLLRILISRCLSDSVFYLLVPLRGHPLVPNVRRPLYLLLMPLPGCPLAFIYSASRFCPLLSGSVYVPKH